MFRSRQVQVFQVHCSVGSLRFRSVSVQTQQEPVRHKDLLENTNIHQTRRSTPTVLIWNGTDRFPPQHSLLTVAFSNAAVVCFLPEGPGLSARNPWKQDDQNWARFCLVLSGTVWFDGSGDAKRSVPYRVVEVSSLSKRVSVVACGHLSQSTVSHPDLPGPVLPGR